ncbi:ABC transporter substrate-binding protein [Candidatus Finniella inopinata]|uniref:ABC transporter substrate-binding protein n=1 Tax=Candidatus Finniella inopinata TaxID=1696036 RepID=A0A4Q7DJP3_9PROT|nr:ABC transporter substrate binding protein [Candidatus Finniella inopinata]RZI47093.1 hypothetical protein EQU50_00465 [Candidatus Finniella inopinata]
MENFFRKLGLEIIIPLILMLSLFVFFISYNQARKKILIIHSYSTDYSWVKEINTGIERVFKYSSLTKLEYFYMDTKRFYQEHFKEKAGLAARQSINQFEPDAVIVCDDDAQSRVTTYYKDNSNIPFVFAAVNANIKEYGFDKMNNVTGILDRLPLEAIRNAILIMADSLKIHNSIRIGHIASDSSANKLDDDDLHQYKDWGQIVVKPSQLVDTFSEWKRAILDADGELDFIILSNYRKILHSKEDPTLVPPKEVMKWTIENAKVPILGINSFVVEDGGPFAISVSGVEQGEIAAKMALKIIQEKIPPKQIPIENPKQFLVAMRPKLMEKFSMVLPPAYAAFARLSQLYLE